jgi:hypothetical protein
MLLELMVKASNSFALHTEGKFWTPYQVAHTSFRSVRVIHRLREREAHAEQPHQGLRSISGRAKPGCVSGMGGTSDRRRDDETVVACREG